MRAVADGIDADDLEATATGQTILFKIVQDQLLETVIQSLIITLVAVFAFLMFTYRITEGSATLGAVTLLPVVFSVSWILGTMWLLGIPFNILTGMITSLTVGLGVAYSIHLSERFNQELERLDSVWVAMDRAVTGTGGALLGSAATTVGGFGVLAFAILPPLQQFGIITGMTIIYAFLASVLVLPSLLVVWTKFFGPGIDTEVETTATPEVMGED
jgi:predicted RND superfamily exporter protein